MAAKRKPSPSVSKQARTAASGRDVRGRVRNLTLRALRDRDLHRTDISDVVHEVLEGASDAVNRSIPSARSSVLRQVFDGLNDAFSAAASAGTLAARSASRRGRALAEHALPGVSRQVRSASDEFLGAVTSFARKTSSEVGDELDLFVKRARRTSGKVGASAAAAARAADGRLIELSGEAARAGVEVARRTAGQFALAASGFLEGLGEAVTPRRPAAGPKRRPAASKRNSKPKGGKKPRTRGA